MEYVQGLSHMNNLEVIYEDNHIIVVVKPPNVLSQKDSTNDIDMLTLVKNYIKVKYNKPGNVYVGLVQRLDRPVGGLMVFAKTSKAASRMSNMIKNHQLTKKYLAVINGMLERKNGEFEDYLLKKENGTTIVSSNGKYCCLKYKVLEENLNMNLSLIEVDLITGRHHQIRVQFASRNHPLYGDYRYGNSSNKQIALWAYKLSLIHPVLKKEMIFEKYPNIKDSAWKYFNEYFVK